MPKEGVGAWMNVLRNNFSLNILELNGNAVKTPEIPAPPLICLGTP